MAALLAGLRAGVGAALVRHTPAQAVILARLEVAAGEFFAAAPALKAAASADASCPAVGPMPVRLVSPSPRPLGCGRRPPAQHFTL